jgi:hypothetical protein
MFIAPDKAVEEGVRKIVNRFPAFIPQRSPDGAWADPQIVRVDLGVQPRSS